MSCCICLNNIDIIEYELEYSCNTCKSGIVCYECYQNIEGSNDRIFCNFVPTHKTMNKFNYYQKEIKKAVSCPCCRSENWKYIFSKIIHELNYKISEYEPPTRVEELEDDEKNVMLVYYRNSLININKIHE